MDDDEEPGGHVMSSGRLLASFLCVAIGVGCGAPEIAPEERAAARTAPPPRPSFSLDPARAPEGTTAPRPDVVVFLPFVNRTPERIHPGLVRSFDRTLAAFSAVFLDLHPVDPEVATALADLAGLPPSDAVASDRVPQALEAVAKRVGAGLVVWGELLPGPRVSLHAVATAPAAGADAIEGWNIDSLPLEGARDTAWYDGPRQLLTAVLRSPPLRERFETHAVPGAAAAPEVAALEASVAEVASGDLARMRRAELALASLALARPQWPAPWIELFALRTQRVTRAAARLTAGPGPARHIAQLLPLDSVQRGRLEALDWGFVGHERPVSELDSLLARLPAGAWERVLLARAEPRLPRSRFGLGHVEASGGNQRAMLAATAAPHLAAAREAVREVASDLDSDELWQSAYLVDLFLGEAEDRSDWRAEATLHELRGRLRTAEGLEVLRGACAPLEDAPRSACRAPLIRILRGRVAALGPADLDDDDAWSAALQRWLSAETGTPAASLVSVPEAPVFAEDPTFAAQWLAVAELVTAADASLAARDEATGGLPPATHLLVTPERIRLLDAVDEMLTAAYWNADLQARRGQHREAKHYLKALDPFRTFSGARFHHARIREKNNFKEAAAKAYTRLAKRDPYDERWVGRWLAYVDYKEKIAWDDSSTAREAEWLGTLVPLTRAVTEREIEAWRDAGRDERALEVLERYEQQRGFPEFALTRDALLARLGRSIAERLARLEGVQRVRSEQADVLKRLVDLRLRSGHYDEAERALRPLLDRTDQLEYACRTLVDLAARQGRAERGGELIGPCIAKAPDKWAAARLWNLYGDGLRVRDRFQEALAAYAKAEALIGGAAWIVDDQALTHVLLGDTQQARAQYEWIKQQYGEGRKADESGRWGLYWLDLRERRPAAAREDIVRAVEHARHSERHWTLLGDTYVREGRLGEFLELCRSRKGYGPRLARIHYLSELGEHDEALRLLESVMAEKAQDSGWLGRKAELLLRAGRPQEALAFADQRLEHDRRDAGATATAVDALLALGRVGEARRRAEDFAAREGETDATLRMLARVARDAGDPARARQLMDRARQIVAWGRAAWGAEADWLVFEVSLGLPPRGTPALSDLERRIERALRRKFAHPGLWQALADVRQHAGNAAGAAEARAERAPLVARLEQPRRVARQ